MIDFDVLIAIKFPIFIDYSATSVTHRILILPKTVEHFSGQIF